ncbi:hypothetical protein NPIL_383811 [Nephila pilipes]|uniref:Uncharacterized protein n=1 Tax=Nephila pilipes TaxID=299642 RepID=A0A8X6PQB1_NEPPI|nr:hypothetical protein NPIL_142681 [Nephila pilipes]GFU08854.1 hypothetical protein NPIL_383811 [Nephila pilipes]
MAANFLIASTLPDNNVFHSHCDPRYHKHTGRKVFDFNFTYRHETAKATVTYPTPPKVFVSIDCRKSFHCLPSPSMTFSVAFEEKLIDRSSAAFCSGGQRFPLK